LTFCELAEQKYKILCAGQWRITHYQTVVADLLFLISGP
jgi:hypothetical protein